VFRTDTRKSDKLRQKGAAMPKRHLEKLRVIIKNAAGLDISYAYDDLVFPEHTAFIFQFDDADENNFFCYFHKDCILEEKQKISKQLLDVCKAEGCTVAFKGDFELAQKKETEEIEIRFLKEAHDE
jgi:cysteinyl-tRNA synthetase